MKYIIATVGSAIVWFVVFIACGYALEVFFPPPLDSPLLLYAPGIAVGFFPARHSWRSSMRLYGEGHTRKQDTK
jgi:hypothetical protein